MTRQKIRIEIIVIFLFIFLFNLNTYSETDDVWTPRLSGDSFKLGGEFELEYVDIERDDEIENPNGHLQLDKFTLKLKLKLTKNFALEALLLFKADKASFSEGYVILSNLPLNSKLKIGLDDRFITEKPKRKTEVFPLIDTAFARDDEFAVTWSGNIQPFYWHLSLSQGLELGTSSPTEDSSYHLIHDNRVIDDNNENKEIGIGLGYKLETSKEVSFDFMFFGYSGKLTGDEKLFLQGIDGYGLSNSDTKQFFGGMIEYRFLPFTSGLKYISALDGKLEREGWYLQLSYLIPGRNNHLIFEPMIRHGRLNVNTESIPGDSLTWDRKMTTIALLTKIENGIMLKTEYYLNDEDTGNGSVANDELLIQLEVKF